MNEQEKDIGLIQAWRKASNDPETLKKVEESLAARGWAVCDTCAGIGCPNCEQYGFLATTPAAATRYELQKAKAMASVQPGMIQPQRKHGDVWLDTEPDRSVETKVDEVQCTPASEPQRVGVKQDSKLLGVFVLGVFVGMLWTCLMLIVMRVVK